MTTVAPSRIDAATRGSLQETVKLVDHTGDGARDRLRLDEVIALIRKIQRRFETRDEIEQRASRAAIVAVECALELIERDPRLQRSHRVDQIGDRFRLNEIHLAVHERAQGEFARPRETRTSIDRALQHLLQDDGTAVRAELDDVLARVGVRRRKPCGDDLIDRPLRSSPALAHARERGVPRQQRCFADQDRAATSHASTPLMRTTPRLPGRPGSRSRR